MKGRILVSGLLVLALGWLPRTAAAQDATTGSIVGTVTDSEGRPVAGATVTIASDQGARTTLTETDGQFRVPYLTPGIYSLTVTHSGYMTAETRGIEVRLLSRVRVEVVLTRGASERIEVVGHTPTIDLSTTTTGATIPSTLMSSIPLGRTFASALALAPTVVDGGIDRSNPSIAGSSGLENTYIVDGMSIGNTGYGSAGSYSNIYGSLGTGVNFDYIEEVQVKTGGYEPEYGEALGGFINLVTKSGTNTFQGSVFSYQQLSELESERESSEDALVSSYTLGQASRDYGFEAGGPLAKDKAFWFAAFDPTFTSVTRRTATPVTEAQPEVQHRVTADRRTYNYAANLKWMATPKHTLTLSAFGDPAVGPNGPHRAEAVAVDDPSTKYSELTYGGHNVVAHWNGALMRNWLVEGTVAYHRDVFREDPAVDAPQGFDFTQPVPERYGGVGFYEDNTSTNAQYQLKFSNFLSAAGEHHLRWGVNYQDIGYEAKSKYTGQPGLKIFAGADTVESSTGYIWYYPGGGVFTVWNARVGELGAKTSADYLAAFVSDTWSPAKYLSLMAGVRYEQETLKGNATEFTWDGNWSPRLHLSLDPTRDDRSKLFLAYGRYFGKVPNDLAVRAMSREVSYSADFDSSKITIDANGNPQGVGPGSQLWDATALGLEPTRIDENAKLSYADEFVAGLEREVAPFLNVSLTYQYRRLGRTLEDVQLVPYSDQLEGESFGEYVITNPGPPDFPDPTRNYQALTLKVEKRLHDDWQVLAAYTRSRLKGNYEGTFRRDNGQSDPFITSAFDFPYLADPEVWGHTSANGLLPNDRPHVFGAYGSYRLKNGLDLGMSVRAESGTPITKLGYNAVYYADSEIPLEPRGASGRTPATSTVGLHVGYPIALPPGGSLGVKAIDVNLNVFNLLNQQKAIYVDDLYEIGGSVTGPPYDAAPCPYCANPDFGKAWSYQPPRQMVLSLRARF